MAVFQYTPNILRNMHVNVPIGTCFVFLINFGTVFIAGWFLKRYGRRQLYIVFPSLIIVVHLVITVLLWNKPTASEVTTNYLCLVMLTLFVIFF
jgi:hypothetical protein